MGDRESQIGITVSIKRFVGNSVNAKRSLLRLSPRWRERFRKIFTTLYWLTQDQDCNNEILGVMIVT
jgi:hypothetical protein